MGVERSDDYSRKQGAAMGHEAPDQMRGPVTGTLDTSCRSEEEAQMFQLKWEGKARDYALITALVAYESAVGLCFSARHDIVAAYIDPGVGAMLVQAIAAAFFGAIFYFKGLRRAVSRIFLKIVGKAPAAEVPAEVPAPEKK
jgi:hypothetical protein